MDTIFNTDGCFYRALDDEPIFVLLARDPCFAETIRAWETSRQALIGRGEKPQGDHKMLLEALATATAGVVWRNDATDPANGFDAGEHARWHVEPVPARELVEVVRRRVRKDTPEGGHVLPYDEWERVKRLAMPLGNRFLIGDVGGDLVLWENMNYRKPGHPEDWTGYYPVNNSLQKDMLWLAYEDWRNQSRNTVAAIKRLAGGEVPTYANILRRANELGTEGCPSELLTKYLLTFADTDPVTFYAGDIRKALEALRRERDLVARPETVTATSGAGEIDPAKEALWIDMAEERGFLSAEDAEKARAALPEGTKAAITSKHMTFIVRDLAREIATGLRQVSGDLGTVTRNTIKAQSDKADDARAEFGKIMDRINGYAAELEAGEAEAARFRSRPIKMHPALGAPYEPDEQPLGDPYRSFAETYAQEHMTVEEARAIVERFRKRFPDLLRVYDPTAPEVEAVPPGVYYGVEGANFYDAKTNKGLGNRFYVKWRWRVAEFPQRVHDEISIPSGYPHDWTLEGTTARVVSREWTDPANSPFKHAMADPGRWSGKRIDPSQYAKDAIEGIGKGFGRSYEDVAAEYRRVHGVSEKAESDTLDVTDTPEMPPHRFTMFTKARGWAYGRGLEINPAHIPDMLDRMDKDGWHLQAVFGGVEPTKVGMLFKRRPPMVEVTLEDYWRPAWMDSVEEMMRAPTEGVDDIVDMGRGREP